MNRKHIYSIGVGGILLLSVAAGFFANRFSPTTGISQEATGVSNVESVGRNGKAEDSSVAGSESQPQQEPVTIVFGGDMMFDRYIRTMAKRNGNDAVFSGVDDVLHGADLVVANLEGPITRQTSVSATSVIGERANYIFTFDPSWAGTLVAHGIRAVNIGNNHILNFGDAGLVETRKFLMDAGVEYFGDPTDPAHRYLLKDVNGARIGFVNYDQFVEDAEQKALEDIRSVRREADTVVAYTHWGIEYEPATAEERRLAHEFVDAGADMIIGSHPHVVQESEEYHGKKIYYSLGNFIFDQYFRPETTHGLLVEAVIDPSSKSLNFQDIPIDLTPDSRTVAVDR